jgi:hypothetical protein
VDRCAECGFEYELDEATSAGPAIVADVSQFVAVLGESGHDLRRRATPDVWSPLEYGSHLRDVLLVQRQRVLAARRIDRPSFEPMGRDERVEHDGYARQDPAVTRQITDAAAMVAHDLARLDDAAWGRTVHYSYPAPRERSLRWVALHTVHEVRHHLLDVRRQVAPGAYRA